MEWIKQKKWHGNPSLGYLSYLKMFKNPFNGRMVNVYVWGLDYDNHFTVSAGANSDYSYSGGFYPDKLTLLEACERVNNLYDQKKLFK